MTDLWDVATVLRWWQICGMWLLCYTRQSGLTLTGVILGWMDCVLFSFSPERQYKGGVKQNTIDFYRHTVLAPFIFPVQGKYLPVNRGIYAGLMEPPTPRPKNKLPKTKIRSKEIMSASHLDLTASHRRLLSWGKQWLTITKEISLTASVTKAHNKEYWSVVVETPEGKRKKPKLGGDCTLSSSIYWKLPNPPNRH